MMKNLSIYSLLWVSIVLAGCDTSTQNTELAEQTAIIDPSHPVVQIETNYGLIWVELFNDTTPKTVENFIQYVNEDFYDETLVHQILPGFIIQAGLFDTEFHPKSVHDPITNEANSAPKHNRGTIAMMRSNHPNSATSEFFINLKDNELFDISNGYAVFGHVIKGMDVLDKISSLPTCERGPFFDDAPCEPVIITKVVEMS